MDIAISLFPINFPMKNMNNMRELNLKPKNQKTAIKRDLIDNNQLKLNKSTSFEHFYKIVAWLASSPDNFFFLILFAYFFIRFHPFPISVFFFFFDSQRKSEYDCFEPHKFLINHKRFDIVSFCTLLEPYGAIKYKNVLMLLNFLLSLAMNKWLLELFLLNFNQFHTLNGYLWSRNIH